MICISSAGHFIRKGTGPNFVMVLVLHGAGVAK